MSHPIAIDEVKELIQWRMERGGYKRCDPYGAEMVGRLVATLEMTINDSDYLSRLKHDLAEMREEKQAQEFTDHAASINAAQGKEALC
jgi:hypothetical protein